MIVYIIYVIKNITKTIKYTVDTLSFNPILQDPSYDC